MAPFESILIRTFTLISNLELSWYVTMLTLSHVYTHKLQKELNHKVNLVILEPCGASEWASPAFIIPKRMTVFDKSLTYAHSIKQSYANNTQFLSSKTC